MRDRDLPKAGKLAQVSLLMQLAKEGSWGWHLQALGRQSLLLVRTSHGMGRAGQCRERARVERTAKNG